MSDSRLKKDIKQEKDEKDIKKEKVEKDIKDANKNIDYHFIPLCYSSFIEDYYSSQIVKKKYVEKDIDILFFGTLNTRRKYIINTLKKKYNVVRIHKLSNDANTELFNLIERSKIVLNVLYYDNNIIFL
jgi:hypothetical protein